MRFFQVVPVAVFLCLSLSSARISRAEDPAPAQAGDERAERSELQKKEFQEKDRQQKTLPEQQGLGDRNNILLPILFYTPDTGVALGGAAVLLGERIDGQKRSNLKFSVILTQKQQHLAQMAPEVYFDEHRYWLRGDVGVYDFPSHYFGKGIQSPSSAEEAYTGMMLRTRPQFYRRLSEDLWVGLGAEAGTVRFHDYPGGGNVASEIQRFGMRQSFLGFGPGVRLDSRNSLFFPDRGSYFEASYLQFEGFGKTTLDARHFESLSPGNIVALQFFFTGVSGEAPFFQLASLGGPRVMRGFLEGRFRDQVCLAAQSEFRKILSPRWAAVAFAGAGTVAASLGSLDRLTGSAGGGLRYFIDVRERVSLRLDAAVAPGSSGVYFIFGEAF